jgi:hypothetical protein
MLADQAVAMARIPMPTGSIVEFDRVDDGTDPEEARDVVDPASRA